MSTTKTKKPQDRLPKKGSIIVVEFRGETFSVDSDALEDVEIAEYLQDEAFVLVVRKTVGRAQWAKFKELVRDEDDRIPVEAFEEFIKLVFEGVGAGN